jgi:hypothetical protein
VRDGNAPHQDTNFKIRPALDQPIQEFAQRLRLLQRGVGTQPNSTVEVPADDENLSRG